VGTRAADEEEEEEEGEEEEDGKGVDADDDETMVVRDNRAVHAVVSTDVMGAARPNVRSMSGGSR